MNLHNLTLKQFTYLLSALLTFVGVIVVVGYFVAGTRLATIKSSWESLQAASSEQATLESALRSAMGYGGMIHNFKNFVLRKSVNYRDLTQGNIGAARAIIMRYKTLDPSNQEIASLDTILSTIDEYEKGLQYISTMTAFSAPAAQIDKTVAVDDKPALKAFADLRQIILTRHLERARSDNKAILASRIRSALGYGGMIHAFKNLVLRRSEKYQISVVEKIKNAMTAVGNYRKQEITARERDALNAIEATIKAYATEVNNVKNLMAADRARENIDLASRVDDGAALEGLRILDQEIAIQTTEKAITMDKALIFIETLGGWIISGTLLTLLVLLSLSVWLLRNLITQPIGNITGVMKALSDGQYGVDVPGTELSNEIGDMARATAVFRENAVQRIEADAKLGDAHHQITESVQYASRIQKSLLPTEDILAESVDDHFVIWQPKDVVGGDLYWVKRDTKGCMIVLFDCTGHGVPGALMTTIAVSAIDHAFDETGDPARLIRQVHHRVKTALGQDGDDGLSDDGLEMGVCLVERERGRLTFAGARFELLVFENGDVDIIKGDKAGVGYRRFPMEQSFSNHVMKIKPGMTFVLFSDGATDQIGGVKGRMFGKKRLCRTLLSKQDCFLHEQGEHLVKEIESYQGEQVRRDDIAVIGFRPIG
jgi:serine phosphatase RsbU (regulator of sigma subunit)